MSTSSGKRRSKSRASAGEPSNYSQLYKSSAAGAAVVVAPQVEEASIAVKGSESVDWRSEYSYVLADLRKLLLVTAALVIGILAVGLIL